MKKALKKNVKHMSSFNDSDMSDDPYAKLVLYPPERMVKFCNDKIQQIKDRICEYYSFTNGRVKPDDVHELCLYKKELKLLTNDTQPVI